jgi:hypothetical protein
MGRARSQTQAVATNNFDSVVGTRRGLGADVQAQRDDVEREQRAVQLRRRRDSDLVAFAASLPAEGEVIGTSYGGALVSNLIKAYEAGACEPGSAKYSEFVEVLATAASSRPLTAHILIAIAAAEEPESAPGLTAPAIAALSQYLTNNSDPFVETGLRPLVSAALHHAEHALDVCFPGPRESAHYQRLQPLCQGIAALIEHGLYMEAGGLCVRAARVLESAPAEALAGPLSSWIEAFTRRSDADNLGPVERDILWRACSAASDDAATAFTPISESLQKQQ